MKIIGEYGYVTKDAAKNYHVYGYGSETVNTQDRELGYRIDPDELESLPLDFPVYASVHDFSDKESSDMHREALDYMDKESLLLIVKRFIMSDKTIPLCDENIYFIAKAVLSLVDCQDLHDFLWTDFANEDLDVYRKELPVQPIRAKKVSDSDDFGHSKLLEAVLKFKAEHQEDLAFVSSDQATKNMVYFKLNYDVINDDVHVEYCDGYHGKRIEVGWWSDAKAFEEYQDILNATLAVIVKNLKEKL